MSEIKIEKGIPIPSTNHDSPNAGLSRVLPRMEVGDSIFIKNSFRTDAPHAVAKMLGMKVSCRKMKDGVRIWRVK